MNLFLDFSFLVPRRDFTLWTVIFLIDVQKGHGLMCWHLKAGLQKRRK